MNEYSNIAWSILSAA